MTEYIENASGQSMRYRCPQVKVIEIRMSGRLLDVSLSGYEEGSSSSGEME